MTDIRGKMRRPSGEWAMPRLTILFAGTLARSRPSRVTLPARGRTTPEIVRSVVVFPAPLLPMSVTISPFSTVIEMPRRAWIWP